jgi:hypothetical protein
MWMVAVKDRRCNYNDHTLYILYCNLRDLHSMLKKWLEPVPISKHTYEEFIIMNKWMMMTYWRKILWRSEDTNPVKKYSCCALRVHADSVFFPCKILLWPRSCYKLKEIFMDKKNPFKNYRLCFSKTRPFEPFNLIGKVELMTTWSWTLFLFMLR